MTSSRSWGFLASFNLGDFISIMINGWVDCFLGNLREIHGNTMFIPIKHGGVLSHPFTFSFPLKSTHQQSAIGWTSCPCPLRQGRPRNTMAKKPWDGSMGSWGTFTLRQTKPIWGICLDRNVYFSHLFPKTWDLIFSPKRGTSGSRHSYNANFGHLYAQEMLLIDEIMSHIDLGDKMQMFVLAGPHFT